MKNRASGFTLIELMIVVAIIGILAAVGYPSYRDYVIRANRSAAQSFMVKISGREEQYILDARSYSNSLATLGLTAPAETSGKYTFSVTVDNAATPPAFTITATAAGSQVSDGDLTLTSDGTKSPAAKW